MKLAYIEENCIIAQELVYLPRLQPVDYGGTCVYSASLHLMDGRYLNHSSLEFSASDDAESQMQVLSLLREDVARSGMRPRSDYLDAKLTLQYRQLTGSRKITHLVSACLCGEKCRYDGRDNLVESISQLVEDGCAYPVCPEILGGLETPRPPCEICGGRVADQNGTERTAEFHVGACAALAAARTLGVHNAVLKERSPSCGSAQIYDGSFSRRLITGQGLTVRLLAENGICVRSEEEHT